ncbi:MAG: cysteine hydrolase family protein, partial [Longimicrobiales bacterium]
NAPDSSTVALLIIDMINDLEFEGGERLIDPALAAARATAALKKRCRDAGIPAIYANDNFGRWRSDFRQVVERVLHDDVRGRPLVELLVPARDDYFVLKPKHSAFFETTLETLLRYLGVRRLILTGITGDICVTLTASDAYMRDYAIIVAEDCTASEDTSENEHALAYCERVLKAKRVTSGSIDLEALTRE